MDKLKSILSLLENNTGNLLLSSSARHEQRPVITGMADVIYDEVVKTTYSASLFMDNSSNGLGLVASGMGDSIDKALEELLQEIE